MEKLEKICETFKKEIFEKYKTLGWEYIENKAYIKKTVNDLSFYIQFWNIGSMLDAEIQIHSSIFCDEGGFRYKVGGFNFEIPFGQNQLDDPEIRQAVVLEVQKQIDATMIPLTEAFEKDYENTVIQLAENGFINPLIGLKNAFSDCSVIFIDKKLGRKYAEKMLKERFALMSFYQQQEFEELLALCEKKLTGNETLFSKSCHGIVNDEIEYIYRNKLKYKDDIRYKEGSVTVNIEMKENDLPYAIFIGEIAALKDLRYGIADNNYILDKYRFGQYTILYDPNRIGCGIEVSFEKNNSICMKLPFPTTGYEIELFYDLIKKVCEKEEVKSFIRNGEIISIDNVFDYIEEDKKASLDIIQDINQSIRNNEKSSVILFGALNPISLGIKEMNKINNSLAGFENLMHQLQQQDVNYAKLRFYRQHDGTIKGVYFVEEGIKSVIPLNPQYPFSDIEKIDSYYIRISDYADIPYEDFFSHTNRLDDYDNNHIIAFIDGSYFNQHLHSDLFFDLTDDQLIYQYENEEDMLKVVLFDKCTKQWKEENADLPGDIQDYASANELLVFDTIKNYNSVLIQKGISQEKRMIILRNFARTQILSLEENE